MLKRGGLIRSHISKYLNCRFSRTSWRFFEYSFEIASSLFWYAISVTKGVYESGLCIGCKSCYWFDSFNRYHHLSTGNLIDNIRKLKKMEWLYLFQHVLREKNFCTNFLTKKRLWFRCWFWNITYSFKLDSLINFSGCMGCIIPLGFKNILCHVWFTRIGMEWNAYFR